ELEKCINADPEFFPAYDALASIYYFTGRKDKTLKIFLEAVKNNPKNAKACAEAGKIFYINKDFEKARSYFLTAYRLNPDSYNKAFLEKIDEKTKPAKAEDN
ncbi:MAG: tetratricopeptide repeat protein, partial [Firmicutes bacterium]|nr:tetratricopeptide repeat protein [Bacillota bacterium]